MEKIRKLRSQSTLLPVCSIARDFIGGKILIRKETDLIYIIMVGDALGPYSWFFTLCLKKRRKIDK